MMQGAAKPAAVAANSTVAEQSLVTYFCRLAVLVCAQTSGSRELRNTNSSERFARGTILS